MKKPKVSIIIPTYNSGETLACCLKSVYSQTYSPIEVIIVDNLSSDDTLRIATDFDAKVIRQKSTPALARNIGIANSTGEYVLFIDSDQVLSRSVVMDCVKNCESENTRMVRIPEIFIGKDFWSTCSAVWKNYYWKVEQKYGTGGNVLSGEPRFFLKEQIALVGMLDPALRWGEDYNLHRKLIKIGVKEALCKSALYHYEPSSIRKILVKNIRYGSSMPDFMKSSENQVYSSVVRHSLLTLTEVFSDLKEKPAMIVGCTFLLGLKTLATAIGFVTGFSL
jgi:GT2 family glycosyltransferase